MASRGYENEVEGGHVQFCGDLSGEVPESEGRRRYEEVPTIPLNFHVKNVLLITEAPFLILWSYGAYWVCIVVLTFRENEAKVWLSALVAGILVGVALNANAYRYIVKPRGRRRSKHMLPDSKRVTGQSRRDISRLEYQCSPIRGSNIGSPAPRTNTMQSPLTLSRRSLQTPLTRGHDIPIHSYPAFSPATTPPRDASVYLITDFEKRGGVRMVTDDGPGARRILEDEGSSPRCRSPTPEEERMKRLIFRFPRMFRPNNSPTRIDEPNHPTESGRFGVNGGLVSLTYLAQKLPASFDWSLDYGTIIRFFFIPFGVSSLSGMTSDPDRFFLVFPKRISELLTVLLIPGILVVLLFIVRLVVLSNISVQWRCKILFLNGQLTA